jgi:predicted chitinase
MRGTRVALTRIEEKSLDRQAFEHFLRTGEKLTSREWRNQVGRKFNPYHDPENGRFTFAPGGGAGSRERPRDKSGTTTPRQAGATQSSSRSTGQDLPSADRLSSSTTADRIRTVMPRANKRADGYAVALDTGMAAYEIVTPEQQAAFLAQIAVESGDLQYTSELLSYSAKRITEVWPNRFPTISAAQPYAHNPEALANRVYANRLGNGNEASGDGFKYRGRGLIQITGRENYRKAGFEDNPEALTEPRNAVSSAASFWKSRNLHTMTRTVLSRRQFDAISRIVNGGNHGSDRRWAAYQRALVAFRHSPPQR